MDEYARREENLKAKIEMYENTDIKRVFVDKGHLINRNNNGQFVIALYGILKPFTGILRSQTKVVWVFDGYKHRLDGPAETGLLSGDEVFWVNGCPLTREEFERSYLITHLREYKER